MRLFLFSCLLVAFACSEGASLSDRVLNETVEAQSETLAECADSTVVEVQAELDIAANGQVETVHVAGPSRAANCVERVVATWTFPAAERGVRAELPLTLTPAPAE